MDKFFSPVPSRLQNVSSRFKDFPSVIGAAFDKHGEITMDTLIIMFAAAVVAIPVLAGAAVSAIEQWGTA
jgi:hypothetical protein